MRDTFRKENKYLVCLTVYYAREVIADVTGCRLEEGTAVKRENSPAAQQVPGPNTLRDHLANERTFLAWMRTAIAIVALGFVVAKFGLVLRELGGMHIQQGTVRLGAIVGVTLVLAGVLAAVLSSFKFMRMRRDIENDVVNFRPGLDIALGVIVALTSLILATYIIFTS